MALTQEQISMMDEIAGFAPENNVSSLSDDDIKKMDEISGLGARIEQAEPKQEIDEIEEEIKKRNPEDYARWKEQEPISPYNAAKNSAREFNGTYDNIDENANLSWFENWLKNSEWSKRRSATVDNRIAKAQEQTQQREQRINNGSATIGDEVSNAFKNLAETNIEQSQQKAEINKVAQGVNEADKTSRYEIAGVSKGGQPIYREVNLLEQIGFLEGMQKNLSKNIPVIGAFADGADNKKQREIKEKILKGEAIRQDELNYLNNALKRKQEEYVRGYSVGGRLGQGTIDSLGISADILLGSGLASALKIGSVATRAASVSGKLAPVAEWGVNAGLGSGVALFANPQRIFANYQERMIGNEMKVTDNGIAIFQESEEKPATALMKSMLGTYIMYFTELGGGELLKGIGSTIGKGVSTVTGKIVGGRSANVLEKLFEKNPKLKVFLDKTTDELSNRYEQLKGMPVVGKSTGWIKDKAHFDGFLEEMGEEALEDVLNLTFGVNNEERSLENYIDAIFKSPEEWAIIAGTIAISGAGLSATSYILGEKMAQSGAIQEDIEDVLLNTTENQKQELISQQMQDGNIDINEKSKIEVEKFNQLKNRLFTQNMNAGQEEAVAKYQADIFAQGIKSLARVSGKSLDEAEELMKLNIQELTPEQAENVLKGKATIEDYKANFQDDVRVAGANESEVEDAIREWEEKGTESKYFKKYTHNAPLVGSEEALNYEFKTGEKVAVNGFHGTQRGDRVGEIFRPDRATSGPMAFFSSDRQISENYAKSKQDTSLSDDMGDYDQWFKLKIGDNSLTLKDAWWNLTSKQRQEIAEKAPHITLDWDADEIIYDENTNRGLGNYDYEIKRYRGNALKTLVESWLTSGTLYDREDDFLKVLDLVGIKREDIDYIDPYTDHSKVYDVFIAFKKPLVTTDIPEKVVKKLEKEAPKHPARYNSYGDPWDKNTQDGVQWITTLKEDIEKNENSYVWTSIPDWVTDVLKGFGYDGVIDMGGKSGGEIHKVYIPFYSEQIKSVDNRGTFDSGNANIYYQNIAEVAKDIRSIFNDVILKGDSKKIKDIFDSPKVKIVKDYFGNILDDVNIRKMPEWMKISDKQYAAYLFLNNTIYINEDYIETFENSDQQYIRTLLHELGHVKQFKLLIYSILNQINPKLSKADRDLLKGYIKTYGVSKEDEKYITGGSNKYTEKKLKNNKNLASKYVDAYNKYSKASLEVDADNVAFALQSLIGQSNNEYIKDYSSAFLAGEKASSKTGKTKEIAAIKAFEKRNTTNQFGFGRISDKVNTRTFYQAARNSYNEEKKNLVADVYKNQVKFYNGEWIHRSLLEKKGIDFDKVEIGDYLDYFEESAREPRAEYNPEFDNIAKEYFGTTTNLNEAGYILNDGSLLDLSGKNMGGPAGRRSLDHREVNSAFIETENSDYEDVGFNEFIDNGAIRFMPESNSFLIARMPSEKQFDELKKILDKKNGEVFIELVDEMEYWGSESHSFRKEYERFSNANKILDDVRTFFNGGKISKFKTYFQPAYHGTRVRGLENTGFDLSYALSGEGAMAHGWGVYTAKDKDVADENYRERLSEKELYVNGKLVDNSEYITLYSILQKEGVDKTSNSINKLVENENKIQQLDKQAESIDDGNIDEMFAKLDKIASEKSRLQNENKEIKEGIKYLSFITDYQSSLVFIEAYKNNQVQLTKGQLYEVDIPEDDVLLDEDEPFSVQPEKVQSAIRKMVADLLNVDTSSDSSINEAIKTLGEEKKIEKAILKDIRYDDTIGKDFYRHLSSLLGSKKEASLKLNEYGVKGITYYGEQDGRCYVIFDENAIKILNTFYQEEQEGSEQSRFYKFSNNDSVVRISNFESLNEVPSILAGAVEDFATLKEGQKYTILREYIKETPIKKKNVERVAKIVGKRETRALSAKTLIFNGVKDGVLEFSNNPDERFKKSEIKIEIKQDELEQYKGRIYPAEFKVKEKINEHNKKVNEFVVPDEPFEVEPTSQETLRERLEKSRGLTTTRFNFDGTVKDNLIVLLKGNADKSTLLHEFAHVYLRTLNLLAQNDANVQEHLNALNRWLDYRGGEYTEKQHEKFAKGFEAYVMSGKAPTYSLKRAFDNFKQWLKEVYNSILFGEMSSEIELDKETKEVFDGLLGDMSIEVRNQKVSELIDKARANASLRLNDDYADNNKIKPNQLTDKQIRYRDTAYNIIWYAIQHSKDEETRNLVKTKKELYMILGNTQDLKKGNKGVAKRRENIEFALRNLEDEFSLNDGFLAEWGEFFSPDLIMKGEDAEFALEAYDVIIDKKYLYSDTNNNEFSEEDLKRLQYEYEYFVDNYKNDYENRDIAMAAYWEWIEQTPEYVQQDFLDKWDLKTKEIDRYESLDKFQKAKEDLKTYAATLKGYGDYSSQFAEYAREILKRLDFMTERDKAKMFNKLKEFNSFRELERNLDDIMDYAKTIDDISMRHQIADKIVMEIRKTTPETINGRRKHLYDYQANKLFVKLREINKLTQEEAQELYDAYVNKELERRVEGLNKEEPTIEDKKAEDFYDDVVNSFIQFKANGMYFNSNELLVTLLEKIQFAKLTGKTARDEIEFEKKINNKNWIDNCAKALNEHKDTPEDKKAEIAKKAKDITKELYSMEANFDSNLYMLFNEKIRKKFTLDTLYAEVDARVGADREEVIKKIAKIFGVDKQGRIGITKLNNHFIEMMNDKYKIKQRYARKERDDADNLWQWEEVELSRMEILYYYIQAKNPMSYEMLTDVGTESRPPMGQFDRGDFETLLNNLTEQEKLMGDILQMSAEKYYPDLNKYHIKKYHIDLGKTTCYFPRLSQQSEINELDLFNQYSEKSINPAFEKLRTAGPSVRIAAANPINVLFSYMQKANTIIVMGEQLDLINKVFRDNDLADKIKAIHGEKAYKEFLQHVTENLYNGQTKMQSEAEGMIAKLMSNVVLTPMMVKPQIGIKQIMGVMNYGVGDENVNTQEWFEEFLKCLAHPKKTIKFMMQDGYTKDRLERANLNEALKGQTDNKLFSRLSLLTDYFTLNMRYGDMLNLCLGGGAYVQALMKKGYTQEQAFELYRKKTISDQQSSINSTLSNLQRNSKSNPFARLVFAYQNTPHQYFRICTDSLIKAIRGDMPKGKALKTIFFYWYLTSFIFNMATSLSPLTWLMTGDDEELKADALLALLGPISCIPFFGESMRALLCALTQQEYFGNRDWFTRFNQAVVKPIKKILDGDGVSWEDVYDSAKVMSQGVGIPLEQGVTTVQGIGDIVQGDIGKGIIKTLGYSEYRANKVFGEEE